MTHQITTTFEQRPLFLIEEGNIEYGNIENCNIDTNLTSKIWRLVTSKKSDGNVKFIIENGKIKTVTSNLTPTFLTSTVKRGQTGGKTGSNGVIASPIIISSHPPPPTPRGTLFDPVLLSMLPFSKSNSCRYCRFELSFFEVDVAVFDVTHFSPFLESQGWSLYTGLTVLLIRYFLFVCSPFVSFLLSSSIKWELVKRWLKCIIKCFSFSALNV